MIKIVKVTSTGGVSAENTSKNGNKYKTLDAEFQVIGEDDTLVAGSFAMPENYEKLQAMALKIKEGAVLSVNFRYKCDQSKSNGKYYFKLEIAKVTTHEINKPEKYNSGDHHIAGRVYKILGIDTYNEGRSLSFLFLSATGVMIPMRHFSSNDSYFDSVVKLVKEGEQLVAGVRFITKTSDYGVFQNVTVKSIKAINRKDPKETKETKTSEASPKEEKEEAPADDDLPF